MQKITFVNGQAPALNASNLNQLQTNIENAINEIPSETVLYDNSQGTTSDITLSDSADNYDYLEIYGYDNDNEYFSTKVYSPNGKTINVTSLKTNGTYFYSKVLKLSISGTSITRSYLGQSRIGNNVSTVVTNLTTSVQMYITRVVGIK